MTHLVGPLKSVALSDALTQLVEAHDFLVTRSNNALKSAPSIGPSWGIQMKRKLVDLRCPSRPNSVLKDSERFVEVINMVATLERLIAGIRCFSEKQNEFEGLLVQECHPSTSHAKGGNDLVLEDSTGCVVVRCEVSDVVSESADSNRKERKELGNLGCSGGVPGDGVRRFLCTSPEFAKKIRNSKRKWNQDVYRYSEVAVDNASQTVLLELLP